MAEDGRNHTVQSEKVCQESRESESSPATTRIAEESKANTHEEARNPSMEWLISIFGVDNPPDDLKAGSKRRIQKVPARIRENKRNRNYFDPQVVSLGPYHHDKASLNPMENHKITAARRFVLYNELRMEPDRARAMETFYNKFKNVIPVAKACYAAETVNKLSDEAFTRMMFLDGCFVLYFIQGMNTENIKLEVSNGLIPLIVQDMFLIENQLPFEVLDALMSLRFDPIKKGKEEILKFISWKVLLPMGRLHFLDSSQMSLIWRGEDGSREDDGPLHLLDILRTMLLGFSHQGQNKMYSYRAPNFGSVMELKEAGIRFGSYRGYLKDIRFEKYFFFPWLLLPRIIISDATIYQLLNLTAFEMSSDMLSGSGVTSYICFLDSLINNDVDVKELQSRGILHHTLGSDEEVARLFNEWPTDGINDLKGYIIVKGRINSHRRRTVETSIARGWDTYFGTPWTVISLVAAGLILFFTCTQTVFTVFPHH